MNVKRAAVCTSIAPDHIAIFLGIVLESELKRGPVTLKCNNTLLNDETHVDIIRFPYPQILGKYKDVESKQLLWELIIMEIWSKTISYSKRIRAEYKKCEAALQNKLEELDHKICHNADLDTRILDEYKAVKKELNTM